MAPTYNINVQFLCSFLLIKLQATQSFETFLGILRTFSTNKNVD